MLRSRIKRSRTETVTAPDAIPGKKTASAVFFCCEAEGKVILPPADGIIVLATNRNLPYGE